jgi:hypothetical protein
LPFASLAVIVSWFGVPAVCVAEPVTTKAVAAPGSTVKGELTAAIRLSPPVRVAARRTPDSALV